MTVKLVLVHSPLVGAESWAAVAADLAGRGYEVSLPDLTGTLTAGPPYVPRQAETIARGASGQPAVLIGHSAAGPLLALAGVLTGQVRGYVFVDARLPIPGQSWAGTAPAGQAARRRELADAEPPPRAAHRARGGRRGAVRVARPYRAGWAAPLAGDPGRQRVLTRLPGVSVPG